MKQAIAILTTAAAIVLGASAQAAEQLVLDGSTTVGPIAKAFAEHFMALDKDVSVTVGESGSGNGAKSLINKTCDIAAMSRFMKDSEFKAAVENGVLPVAHVIALDGIAIITHPSNPAAGLTVQQVRDIYSGKIANWKELGGPDREIIVVTRDTNSGTYETFYGLVMEHKRDGQDVKEKIKAGAETVGSNGAARQRVQSTEGAIAYVGLGFLDRTVKALKINEIECVPVNVQTGIYPISRPLYLFTNGYPALGGNVYRFVTLHLGKKGHEIVESLGFVPVTAY